MVDFGGMLKHTQFSAIHISSLEDVVVDTAVASSLSLIPDVKNPCDEF